MDLIFKIKNLLFITLIFWGNLFFFKAQLISNDKYKAGADRPELYLPKLKGKTIAVVTNPTGLLRNHTHIVDFLVKNNIRIKTIFAPEHGFRGEADAGETVKNGTDIKTGLPIISLYGNNKKPTAGQLEGIDLILFDIQDVGVRFYTYISTLTYVMEAAAENGKEVLVLDRPNPHDGYIDGPVLKKEWKSFVGMHEVPVVYGLTIGEYGNMINKEGWLENGVKAKYSFIAMQDYHKKQRYPLLEKPSPNLPNAVAINLYPSLCFFEGTEVSVGRGTDLPFQVYGSPWTKNFKYRFVPQPNAGAKEPFLKGELCFGENLSHLKKPLYQLNLVWLLKAYQDYKNPEKNFFLENLFFDKLAGSDDLRKQIVQGKSEKEIRNSWEQGLKAYQKIRKKYIAYPD